jgi:hypothetical protein
MSKKKTVQSQKSKEEVMADDNTDNQQSNQSALGSVGGVVTGIGGAILNDPQIRQTLLNVFLGWITGLLHPKAKAPVVPATKPVLAPVQISQEYPDDIIPNPKPVGRSVVSVELKLGRAQYNKERFPEQYTEDNPFGLYSGADLRAIQDGSKNLNWGSKLWLDLTARDQNKAELLRPDILTLGLAFRTEHHCGDAFIKGHGPGADGGPQAGYETNDTDAIGNGEAAWISSLGFLHQMKAFAGADNGEFECWGSVGGVESNRFTIRVS